MKRIVAHNIIIWLFTALALGCDTSPDTLDQFLACRENETRACVCRDGRPGTQVCIPGAVEGTEWAACICTDGCIPSVERCDGIDNNCNGMTDEGIVWVHDFDSDQYADPDTDAIIEGCEDTETGNWILENSSKGDDCDDNDPNTYAADTDGSCLPCQDRDSDQHGVNCVLGGDCDDTPESGAGCHEVSDCVVFYRDKDSDGFGEDTDTGAFCTRPDGWVVNGDDCDDNPDTEVACGADCYPNAPDDTDYRETCDGYDNDCNPDTPDGISECQYGCNHSDTDSDPCYTCEPGSTYCNALGEACDRDFGCNGICDSKLSFEGAGGTTFWRDRIRLRIPKERIESRLLNFPVYVDLADLGSDFFDHVVVNTGDDGFASDIRVTGSDGLTTLSFDLVAFDRETQTGELHFLAPSLSGVEDNVFFIYYGNADAITAVEGQRVWVYYNRVWHLEEDPNTGGIYDASEHSTEPGHIEGTVIEVSDSRSGKLGGANRFDGDSDDTDKSLIRVTDNATERLHFTGPFTLSAWINPFDNTTNVIFNKGDETTSSGYALTLLNNKVSFLNNGAKLVESSADIPLNKWTHMTVTWDMNTLRLYVNGKVSSENSAIGTLQLTGSNTFVFSKDTESGGFDGDIDEVRLLHGFVRSADFVAAQFENQNDTSKFYIAHGENCADTAPNDNEDCFVDVDGDGFISMAECPGHGNDCDDSADKLPDVECHSGCVNFIPNADGDSRGDVDGMITACSENPNAFEIGDVPYILYTGGLSDCDDDHPECVDNCELWYKDFDRDGYADPDVENHPPLSRCPGFGGDEGYVYFSNGETQIDCNDGDPLHWSFYNGMCDPDCIDRDSDGRGPGCDLGDDCSNGLDNPLLYPGVALYPDLDGDGFGADPGSGGAPFCVGCTCFDDHPEVPLVLDGTDCSDMPFDPGNPDASCGELCYPGNILDICDGFDNDCDGETDEDPQKVWFYDADGDGYTSGAHVLYACAPPSEPPVGVACADTGCGWVEEATVEDCAPLIQSCNVSCVDADGDGLLDCNGDDCVDLDGDGYGRDGANSGCEDSNGQSTSDIIDCDDHDPACVGPCHTFYIDRDGDGRVDLDEKRYTCKDPDDTDAEWVAPDTDSEIVDDCNDEDPNHWSRGTDTERCDDDCVDPDSDHYGQGCDLGTDCGDQDPDCTVCLKYHVDQDGDGVGGEDTEGMCDKTPPTGYSSRGGDCDDNDSAHWDTDTGGCDGDCVDNDSDGRGENCDLGDDCDDTPETGFCFESCGLYYVDQDCDGHGNPNIAPVARCEAITEVTDTDDDCYVADNKDCDDDDALHWSDCDCIDNDHDGFGEGCALGPDCDDGEGGGTCPMTTDGDGNAVYNDCSLQPVDADGDGHYSYYEKVTVCSEVAIVPDDCDDYSSEYYRSQTICNPEDPTDCEIVCLTLENHDDCDANDLDGDGRGTGCDFEDCDEGADENSSGSLHWSDCGLDDEGNPKCKDEDGDGRGDGCDMGPDCWDNGGAASALHWSFGPRDNPTDCDQDCIDMDGDGYGEDCDLGPDCDDTPAGDTPGGAACNTGCTVYYNDADGDERVEEGSAISSCAPDLTAFLEQYNSPEYAHYRLPTDSDPVIFGSPFDCNDNDPEHWSFGPVDNPSACDDDCDDRDGDGYGPGCDLGGDCDNSPETGIYCWGETWTNGTDTFELCLNMFNDGDGDGLGYGRPISRCLYNMLAEPNSGATPPYEPLNYDALHLDFDLVEVGGDCNDTDGEPCTLCDNYYRDSDGDGYGVSDTILTIRGCVYSPPEGYTKTLSDCDDTDPLHWSYSAGSTNRCDADCQDPDGDGYGPGCDLGEQDCDNTAQTGALCPPDACYTYYADFDMDFYGNAEMPLRTCEMEAPTGYVENSDDCDDGDPGCYTNCLTWYEDTDQDGFGNPNRKVVQCADKDAPMMHVLVDKDCDDSSSTGARCHDDCVTYYYDLDNDGYGVTSNSRFIVRCRLENGGIEALPSMSYLRGDCDETSSLAQVRNPGMSDLCDGVDNDCDPGTPDGSDECGGSACTQIPNGGGFICNSDCVDGDSDGDDVCDTYDNCICSGPENCQCADADGGTVCNPYNPDQEDQDGDGIGDACEDFDHDGVDNTSDNCSVTSNPEQIDSDNDTYGDACDVCPGFINQTNSDSDEDSYGDECDVCPQISNPGQEDGDGDGYGDACDACPLNPDGWDSTSCAMSALGISVDYRPYSNAVNETDRIRFEIHLNNDGAQFLPLAFFKIRYWYNMERAVEEDQGLLTSYAYSDGVWLAPFIDATFVEVSPATNSYFAEIRFAYGSHVWLSPGDTTGEMQFEIFSENSSSDLYVQSNDYSFSETESSALITDYQKITVYYWKDSHWNLVSGVEPVWAP